MTISRKELVVGQSVRILMGYYTGLAGKILSLNLTMEALSLYMVEIAGQHDEKWGIWAYDETELLGL